MQEMAGARFYMDGRGGQTSYERDGAVGIDQRIGLAVDDERSSADA
jgi:hypothetical protein